MAMAVGGNISNRAGTELSVTPAFDSDSPRPFDFLIGLARYVLQPYELDDEGLNELISAAARDWVAGSPDRENGPSRAMENEVGGEPALSVWLDTKLRSGWFNTISKQQVSIGGPVVPSRLGPFGTGAKPTRCIWTGSMFDSGASSWTHMSALLRYSTHARRFEVRPEANLLWIDSFEAFATATITFGSGHWDIDWNEVAAKFDGVHMTAAAIMEAPRRHGFGLASWTTESTAWFSDHALATLPPVRL